MLDWLTPDQVYGAFVIIVAVFVIDWLYRKDN